MTFEEPGRYTDAETGKPVANVTRFTRTDGDERYVATYTRHADLSKVKFIDDRKAPKKAAAKISGFDGADLRSLGEVRIEHDEAENLAESHVDDALWELMYSARAGPDSPQARRSR